MRSGGEVDVRALIAGLRGLSELEGPVWKEALAASIIVHERAGADLGALRDKGGHLALVLQGSIMVRVVSEDGRIFNVLHVREGEMCLLSLAVMLGNFPLASDVITEEETVILRVPRTHVERLLAASAPFRQYLMTSMSSCFVKMLDLVEEVAFDRLHTRIANHLEARFRRSGRRTLPLTHQELAYELGSSREVVSRLLKALERSGRIRLGRGRITLLGSEGPRQDATQSASRRSA